MEVSIGGYFVVVIKVIIGGSFYVNMESLHAVQMKAFLLELQYLQDVMGNAKGVHMFI